MILSRKPYLALTMIIALGTCGTRADTPATAGGSSNNGTGSPQTAAPAISDKDRKAIETIRKRVAAKGNLDAVVDEKSGDTPLITAIRLDQVELADALLQNGAGANVARKDGFTPLMIACYYGDAAVVKLLIKHGADPKQSTDGLTPLYEAACDGSADVVKMLLAAGAPMQTAPAEGEKLPIYIAVENGHADAVQLLIDRGANPKVILPETGDTLLHVAAYFDHPVLVKLFVKEGIDVSARNATGLTPLHLAAQALRKVYLKVTVAEPGKEPVTTVADVSHPKRRPDPPLAPGTIDPDLLGKMLTTETQERPDTDSPWTITTYEYAQYVSIKAARALLAIGANVNAKDDQGETPLDLIPESDRRMDEVLKAAGGKSGK